MFFHLAYALGKRHFYLAFSGFLVDLHDVDYFPDVYPAWRLGRKSRPLQKKGESFLLLFAPPCFTQSDFPLNYHSRGNRFSVGDCIVGKLLDCVTDRVSEIKDFPQVLLLFVLLDHFRLDPAACLYHFEQRFVVKFVDSLDIFFQVLEEILTPYYAVFDYLGKPLRELLRFEGFKRVCVHIHSPWLIEGTDEVFSVRGIYSSFSSHRTVNAGN